MASATLGLKVESSGVEKGTLSLEKLSTAARGAEAATRRLGASAPNAAGRVAQVTGSVEREAEAMRMATTAANAHARAMKVTGSAMRAANDNFTRSGLSAANLAAQFQDIGVSAAMSQNPLQIALQQGTQISAVLGPMGAAGALKSLGVAFASVISPLSLATIGLTALAAIGLQSVDWSSTAQMAMNGLADGLEVIGPYATGAAAGLALLYAPSVVTGIASATTAIVGMGKAALFAAGSLALANPGVAIVAGITASVAALNIFRDEITNAFGVDLVGVIKGWGNTMIDVVGVAWNGALRIVQAGVNQFIDLVNPLLDRFGSGFGPVNFDSLQVDVGADHIGNIAAGISNMASGAAEALRNLAGGIGTVSAATAAQKEQEDALNRALEQRNGLIEKLQTPWQAYADTLRTINALQQQNMLTAQQSAQLHLMAGAQISGTYLGIASTVSGALSSAFQANKAFGIANAVINTAQGVTQALATYPPPFSFAAAGSVAAAGALQIATISSTSPGSGGGGRSSFASSGGGAPANRYSAPQSYQAQQPVAPQQAPAQQPAAQSVHVTLPDRTLFRREEFLELIEGINEAIGDGARITASS